MASPLPQLGTSAQLKCTKEHGAVLVIKENAYRSEAKSQRALIERFNAYFDQWFKHITGTTGENLGVDIDERDLVVVTGSALTKEWATSIIDKRSDDADFQVSIELGSIATLDAGAWIKWESNITVPHREGPRSLEPPPAGAQSSAENDPQFNQCIFLTVCRRYSRRERFLQKLVQIIRSKPEDAGDSRDFKHVVRNALEEGKLDELSQPPDSESSGFVRHSQFTRMSSFFYYLKYIVL